MHVVIFEGSRWPTFAPLSLSRPVFALGSGMGTLLDKQVRYLAPTRLSLWVRPGLEEYCRRNIVAQMPCPTSVNQPLDDEPALLVNGATLHLGRFEYPAGPAVDLDADGQVKSALVRQAGLSCADALAGSDKWQGLGDLPHTMPQSRMAAFLWDLLSWNEESLVDDWTYLHHLSPATTSAKPAGPYHLVDEANVHIAAGARIGAGAVLDGSTGPVFIGAGAVVGANAVLNGPSFVGPGTQLAPLSLVRPGTSIAQVCRVGGEISNAIIMAYSNKAHDGFLGDSYLGQWINIGAGTSTSNRKNTYGTISLEIGGRTIPTGKRGLGTLMGDHSKTAIGTRLMTGTYVGYCCSIATSALTPRFVPSYSFLTDKGAGKYDASKALEVMKTVYARRNRLWSDADARLAEYAAQTAPSIEGPSR